MNAVDRRSNRCHKCGCPYTSRTHQTRCLGKSVQQFRAGLRAAYQRRKVSIMKSMFNRPVGGQSDAITRPPIKPEPDHAGSAEQPPTEQLP